MPQLDNSLADDPIFIDGDISFSAGQASNVRKNVIGEGAYDIGRNVDFDMFGNVSTRRGTAQLQDDVVDSTWDALSDDTDVTGDRWEDISLKWSDVLSAAVNQIAYFDTPSPYEKIVIASNDEISLAGETGSIVTVSGASYSGEDVYFAQLVDRMYYCDGVAAGLSYLNDSSTNAAVAAGKITSVRISVNGKGYTTAPTVTVAGAGSGSGATFSVTMGPGGRVVDIAVTAQGSNYDRATSISLTAAPSGGTDATAEPRVSATPSKPKLLTAHSNRLFCSTADTSVPGDTLYVSDILDGESFDLLGNSIRIGGGDGDPITALLPWFGFKMLVFKERSVWSVDANPAQEVGDWEIKLINNRVGCIAWRSAQQVGPDVFFLSRDGVRSLSTIESGAQTDVSSPISAPINDYIERITRTKAHRSCAVYYRNRYLLSVAMDGGTEPTTTLVFNAEQKSWSGYWSGWTPLSYAVTAFGGKIRLQFGDNSGKLFTWLDYVAEKDATDSYYKDQTTGYATKLTSRAYNFKEVYADKLGYQVEYDLDNRLPSSQTVDFFFLKNMTEAGNELLMEDSDTITDEAGDPITEESGEVELESGVVIPHDTGHYVKAFNMLSRGKFKEIQYIVTTDVGRLSLHSIKASAFSDAIDPER
tara:strand:- start:1151 stop:3082 length:1932 start_codon:yes stop_codon:yes gene_type:complete